MRDKKETVRDCMSTELMTVNPGESLQTAIKLLDDFNIRELPVVEEGKLVGIITDRDLRQVSPSYTINRDPPEIRAYLQAMTVGSAMTRDPLFVYPDMPLVRAARLLRDCRVGSLPVVESERLVGILSISDLLDVFIEQNES